MPSSGERALLGSVRPARPRIPARVPSREVTPMDELTTDEKIAAMILGGLADDAEDARAQLVDMGEIDEDEEPEHKAAVRRVVARGEREAAAGETGLDEYVPELPGAIPPPASKPG